MQAHFSGICISSTSGSGGKTLLSLGLGRFLKNSGIQIKPFKKGPDYIDAAWLSAACGMPATNLDPFFLEADSLKKFFSRAMLACQCEFALLEGNRGLYDGLDEHGSCSTASLARLLGFPILLAIDCAKSTRTIAAILKGMTEFEEGLNFAGVALNNIASSRHEQALTRAIANYSSLKILGCLPRLHPNPLPERHMGLAANGATFTKNADELLDKLADIISHNCDVPAILQRAQMRLPMPETSCDNNFQSMDMGCDKVVIGYARDRAFWFYYRENLESLEKCGAQLTPLSLTRYNPEEWQNLSGLYIGGGFPEDFCRELSSSGSLARIKTLASNDFPIYAECGGLMLLCRKLARENEEWPMAGLFNLDIRLSDKPQGLGYVKAQVVADNPYFPVGLTIKGHEFHYSRCSPSGPLPEFKLRLERGTGIQNHGDGIMFKNAWASYLHIFAPAIPCWASNFARLARNFSAGKTGDR